MESSSLISHDQLKKIVIFYLKKYRYQIPKNFERTAPTQLDKAINGNNFLSRFIKLETNERLRLIFTRLKVAPYYENLQTILFCKKLKIFNPCISRGEFHHHQIIIDACTICQQFDRACYMPYKRIHSIYYYWNLFCLHCALVSISITYQLINRYKSYISYCQILVTSVRLMNLMQIPKRQILEQKEKIQHVQRPSANQI